MPLPSLDVRRCFYVLLILDSLFVFAHLLARATNSEALLFMFDLDRELTVASWYASSKLLVVALAFTLTSQRHVRSPFRWLFLLFAFGFLYFSADEAASLHEGLAEQLQFEGWFVIYGIVALGFLLVIAKRLWQLWRTFPRLVFLLGFGMGLIVLGSVGVEELRQELLGRGDAWYTAQVALEEGLELFGASFILYASLCWLTDEYRAARTHPVTSQTTFARDSTIEIE
jgi:hypothetical protein